MDEEPISPEMEVMPPEGEMSLEDRLKTAMAEDTDDRGLAWQNEVSENAWKTEDGAEPKDVKRVSVGALPPGKGETLPGSQLAVREEAGDGNGQIPREAREDTTGASIETGAIRIPKPDRIVDERGRAVEIGAQFRAGGVDRIRGFFGKAETWVRELVRAGVSAPIVEGRLQNAVESTDALVGSTIMKYDAIKDRYGKERSRLMGGLAMFGMSKSNLYSADELSKFAQDLSEKKRDFGPSPLDELKGCYWLSQDARDAALELISEAGRLESIKKIGRMVQAQVGLLTRQDQA